MHKFLILIISMLLSMSTYSNGFSHLPLTSSQHLLKSQLVSAHDSSNINSFNRCDNCIFIRPLLTIRTLSTARRKAIIMMGQKGKRLKKDIKRERQMEVPPRIQTPYGPVRMMRPLTTCDICAGRGQVRCNVCNGRGITRATGQRKRNALNIARATGSLWTSVEIREGHRHYVCTEMRGSRKKKNLNLRMSNSCGPEETRVHLWISEEEIRDKSAWRMGWVTLEEIRMADKGPLLDAKTCFRCKGQRIITCVECEGRGKIGYNQQLYD